MITNELEFFKKCKCGVCKKKVAVHLCDFIVDYNQPSFYRTYHDFSKQKLLDSCGFPMCEDCTSKYNRIYDFCPFHSELVEKVKPTLKMKGSINEYIFKEIFDY